MAPRLEKVFVVRGFLDKTEMLSLGPVYTKTGPQRTCAPVSHGTIEGSGIKASLMPGGSDWILMDPATGIGHIDVRLQGRLDDGCGISSRYTGIIKFDEKSGKALSFDPEATSTDAGDHYWFITPTYETNSEDLKWLTEHAFIGQGHWHIPGDGRVAFEYDIFKVMP